MGGVPKQEMRLYYKVRILRCTGVYIGREKEREICRW